MQAFHVADVRDEAIDRATRVSDVVSRVTVHLMAFARDLWVECTVTVTGNSRPGLKVRDREIAAIASLAAMGNATPQLKVHIEAGLNVGLTREEMTEILMQMAVNAGFPAAANGLLAAKEVFGASQDFASA